MAELSAELLRLLVHHVEVNYGNIDIRHHPTNGLVLRLVPPSGGQTIEVEFRLLARIAMQNGQGTQNPSDRFVRQTSAVTKILNHLLNVAHKGRSTASGRGNLDKSVSPSLDNARRGSPVAPPLPPQPEEDQDTRRVIYDLLVHKYPFLATWHQGVVDNIVGAIQAGKTEVIMALLWVHTYWHKHDSVLVSMNDIGSYRQIFVRDVYQFNHWLQAQSGWTQFLVGVASFTWPWAMPPAFGNWLGLTYNDPFSVWTKGTKPSNIATPRRIVPSLERRCTTCCKNQQGVRLSQRLLSPS